MTTPERNGTTQLVTNEEALAAHQALLRFCGGYTDEARAARERSWKALTRG